MSKEKKKQQSFIVTPLGRVAFPNIRERGELSKKFDLNLIFEKGADLSELQTMAKKCAKAKWPKKLPKGFQNPFKDCEDKEEYDGFADGWKFVTAKSNYRPGVVDSKRNIIDIEDMDERLYGGCYAKLALTCYAYDQAGNRGVGFGLQAVMVVKDGEPFGNRVDAETVFDPIDDDDEDDFSWGDDGDDDEDDIPF